MQLIYNIFIGSKEYHFIYSNINRKLTSYLSGVLSTWPIGKVLKIFVIFWKYRDGYLCIY